MSAEPPPHTTRLGAVLVALAVGGSAIGALAWHLLSNRAAGPGLDTSGFDMSTGPAPAPPPAPAAPAPAPAPAGTSLGMTVAEEDMTIVGQRAARPAAPPSAS